MNTAASIRSLRRSNGLRPKARIHQAPQPNCEGLHGPVLRVSSSIAVDMSILDIKTRQSQGRMAFPRRQSSPSAARRDGAGPSAPHPGPMTPSGRCPDQYRPGARAVLHRHVQAPKQTERGLDRVECICARRGRRRWLESLDPCGQMGNRRSRQPRRSATTRPRHPHRRTAGRAGGRFPTRRPICRGGAACSVRRGEGHREEPVTVETQILWGPPDTALIDESHGAAMVCVGSLGIGPIARKLLGSTGPRSLRRRPARSRSSGLRMTRRRAIPTRSSWSWKITPTTIPSSNTAWRRRDCVRRPYLRSG